MLNLIYSYKLKPTSQQIEQIELNLAICKSVWNHALYVRKLWSNSRKCDINKCSIFFEYIVNPFEYPNYHTQSAELTKAKKKTTLFSSLAMLKRVPQTLRKLDRSFQDMKSKGMGFPRYKKQMKFFVLVATKKTRLVGNTLLGVPLFKEFRVKNSRDIPEEFKVKQIQILKKASGYYVNLAIVLDVDVVKPIPHGHAIGLDVGIKSMIATSDGLVLPRPKFLDKALRKIKLLQRKLRNKKKGSNKWLQLNHRIALLYEAVANKRKDYHFKLAHKLCENIGMLFVEDINFGSWSKGLFCKQSNDMGIGQFFTILEYVCFKTDTYFAKVDKNHTSQICPNYGTYTGKKDLSVREHNCFECGYKVDRDVAAAEVVKSRGLENIAVGTTVIKQPSDGGLTGAYA